MIICGLGGEFLADNGFNELKLLMNMERRAIVIFPMVSCAVLHDNLWFRRRRIFSR
jgi:hypothetical protein